jgi:protocatechuate 3,4-dioxygenase beta subunit
MKTLQTTRLLTAAALLAFGGTGALSVAGGAQGVTPVAPRDVRPQPVTPPPRDPGDARPPVVVGKGVISGTIVAAASGQPARRARVNLSGTSETGGNRVATTDDNGRFSFTALPEGRFTLTASKAGYLNVTYGQRRPGRPGTPIQLADGQRLQVQLQMIRGGVITGTVLDEHGETIPGTPVRSLRYVFQSGQRALQSAGSGQTDDRGIYRIYALQPGDYLVFATPRNAQGSEAARQVEVQAALQQQIEVLRSTQAQERVSEALTERLTQLKVMAAESLSASGDEPATGYAPVYYPGTTSPASAMAITVGPGEEKSGIDFQYQVVPIARIDGIVTSAATQLPNNVQVTLVNTGFAVPGVSPGGARADAQGAFRIANVPPGQYTLVARAQINPGAREGGPGGRGIAPGQRGEAAGRGRAGGPAADPIRLWASTDVTVDGRNVSNVVLTLQPGLSVSGRIAFDGATPPPPDLTRLRVNLSPVIVPGMPGEVTSSAPGRVDAEGRFTITSVVPGRYRLSASGVGNGWFLGSSAVEGQDSLDFPIEVKPGQNIASAVVTFVDRQTELTGSIVNDRSEPVSDYTLIVYPADNRYWTPQSRRIQSTRPATDGRFTFRNLPAGDYRLAPVFDPEPGSWFDPSFLQQLDNAAVRVTIGEGEKKEQTLRVPGG